MHMSPRGRNLLSAVVLIGLLSGGLLIVMPPARASCVSPAALPSAVRQAAAAFVGTVTSTTWDGRRAAVLVDDVWHGKVSAFVVVVGTPGDAHSQTTVDRHFDMGARYLFLPFSGATGRWEDNGCSSTQEYSPALARLRPTDARRVTALGPTVDASPSTTPSRASATAEDSTSSRVRLASYVGASALALATASGGLFAWRRRGRRRARRSG
jgi:hypothetical protein